VLKRLINAMKRSKPAVAQPTRGVRIIRADIGEVALVPGTGGVFSITCNDEPIWERKRDGGFPEAAKLKQLVRDVCAHHDGAKHDADNAALIARLRVSKEGQEGLSAFLDKRKPNWMSNG